MISTPMLRAVQSLAKSNYSGFRQNLSMRWLLVLVDNWNLVRWWWNCYFNGHITAIFKQYLYYFQTSALFVLVHGQVQCYHTLHTKTIVNLWPPSQFT
jgi:hypothetical protein